MQEMNVCLKLKMLKNSQSCKEIECQMLFGKTRKNINGKPRKNYNSNEQRCKFRNKKMLKLSKINLVRLLKDYKYRHRLIKENQIPKKIKRKNKKAQDSLSQQTKVYA